MRPLPGDLLFYSGTSIWSRIIRARSRSQWSHVGIYCEFEGRRMVIESLEGKGVRIVPLAVWQRWPGHIAVGHLKHHPETRLTIVNAALLHVGDEYASPSQFIRSFSFAWSRIVRALKWKADTHSSRWFCSELVAWALTCAGWTLPAEPARLTPGDLARWHHIALVPLTD